MPNWTSCYLSVSPSQDCDAKSLEALPRFKQAAKDAAETGRFFAVFVPMPSEMEGLSSGSTTIDGKQYSLWREVVKGTGEPAPDWMNRTPDMEIEQVGIDDATIARWRLDYGAAGWYDWNVNNWGTKWDVSNMSLHETDGDLLVCNFDTAWSPPEAFVRHVSQEFPGLEFTLAYAEQGSGFAGMMKFVGGEVVDSYDYNGPFYTDTPKEGGDPDDEEYELEDEVAAHLEQYSLHEGG